MTEMHHEVDQVVRDAWCSALDLPDSAAGADFFAAGGTSFSAVMMMERVEAALGIEFPLETLFLEGDLGAVLRECQDRYTAARAAGNRT